jgi:hypothetical protein
VTGRFRGAAEVVDDEGETVGGVALEPLTDANGLVTRVGDDRSAASLSALHAARTSTAIDAAVARATW